MYHWWTFQNSKGVGIIKSLCDENLRRIFLKNIWCEATSIGYDKPISLINW